MAFGSLWWRRFIAWLCFLMPAREVSCKRLVTAGDPCQIHSVMTACHIGAELSWPC